MLIYAISYTTAMMVSDEKADTLRPALIITTSLLKTSSCSVRVDTAPGFLALRDDDVLNSSGITLDFGRIKNKDSNSVVDKGIQELETELLKHGATGCLTPLQLQQSVDTLNSRIRNRHLSAKEIIFKRDQYSNAAIDVKDNDLSAAQRSKRAQNHLPSSLAKAGPNAVATKTVAFKVGDLVYIKTERDKHKPRDRYIITKIDGLNALIQKLNDKLMSRQYQIPLAQLYLAQPTHTTFDRVQSDSSSSDDDDYGRSFNDNGAVISETDLDTDGSSDTEEARPDTGSAAVPEEDVATSVGRGQRNRREPEWMRSGDYVLS